MSATRLDLKGKQASAFKCCWKKNANAKSIQEQTNKQSMPAIPSICNLEEARVESIDDDSPNISSRERCPNNNKVDSCVLRRRRRRRRRPVNGQGTRIDSVGTKRNEAKQDFTRKMIGSTTCWTFKRQTRPSNHQIIWPVRRLLLFSCEKHEKEMASRSLAFSFVLVGWLVVE